MEHCYLIVNLENLSSVSVVDFEHVIAGWDWITLTITDSKVILLLLSLKRSADYYKILLWLCLFS